MIYVSVVMPVFNCEKYLAAAIESILQQTFRDFEFIIINDGSTDNSKIIIESYLQDSRIVLINHNENKGLSYSLNEALCVSKGKYIARMDADDISFNNRLEEQLKYFHKYPYIKLLGSFYISIDQNGDFLKINKHPSNCIELAYNGISNTFFCHPSIMFNSEVLKEITWYDETEAEDFSFISKVIKLGPCSNLTKPLIFYREHFENRSFSKSKLIEESVLKITLKNIHIYVKGKFFQNQYLLYRTGRNRNLFVVCIGVIIDIFIVAIIIFRYKKIKYVWSGILALINIYIKIFNSIINRWQMR